MLDIILVMDTMKTVFFVFTLLALVMGMNTQNSDCVCTTDYAPVCATSDLTYGNRCQLECANDTFLHNGPCKDQAEAEAEGI